MTERFLVTRLGVVVAGACLLSYVVALAFDWREFAALALGFAIAILAAVPFVATGGQLQLQRRIEPPRVEVGSMARSLLTVTNASRRRTSPRVIEDGFGDLPWHHDVPSLEVGGSTVSENRLPTDRRGVFDIGPATLVKTDPLGMVRRSLGRTDVSRLWVHPRSAPLASLRSGFAKDLEGPTSDTSPAGDVSFHTVREYVHGDDVRHVHWLSTAKTGTLMVRHYVDNRRPYLGVLVDTDPERISDAGFERALEIAASHLRSAELDGRPVAVMVGDQEVMTPTSPVDTEAAVDRLCRSTLDGSEEGRSLDERARHLRLLAPGISALLVVTGDRSGPDLLEVVDRARRHGRVIVARLVPAGTEAIGVPGARIVDCQDLDGFVAAWTRVVG